LLLARQFPAKSWHDIGQALLEIRATKDEEEIAGIRRSVGIVEAAMSAAASVLRPGVSELELLHVLEDVVAAEAGPDVDVAYSLGSGPRSAEADPRATTRRIQPGDLVLIDLYPTIGGYVSDLARTFAVGDPSPDYDRVHGILIAALDAASSELRPGASASRVAMAALSVLSAETGGRAGIRHHIGHGIGILPWEPPWIGAESEALIVDGSIVALEVGLYDESRGGIRIESNYLVHEDGPERLDRLPLEGNDASEAT
jgi:Xaa-Pro dipeptidase